MSVAGNYESWVKPHLDDLRRYCFYLTKSKWDGEDLFQESLLKTMTYFLGSEPRHNIKPFLIQVARNLWIDNRRTNLRRLHHKFQSHRTWDTDSDYVEIRSMVEWMAERFPPRNIEMWLLTAYFGYSMQDVAGTFNCSLAAVKSTLHRTRVQLRKLKSEKEGETKLRIFHLDVECWSQAIMHNLPPCL